MKVREVIAFKNYFEDFLNEQPTKVQDKIFKIIDEFIFLNTGLIREYGNERIQDLIAQNNIQQAQQNE